MSRTRIFSLAVLAPLTVAALLGSTACKNADKSDKAAPAATGDAPEAKPTEEAAPMEQKEIDPCALVSQQEAEALTKTPLDPAKRVRGTCTYTGPVTGPTAQVEVFTGDGVTNYLNTDRELGHEFRTLAGLGDEAYAEDEAVFLRKGQMWVAIRLVRLNDPAENRKPLEELARKVADRL